MPEEWEVEVRRLREIKAPASLDHRVAEGPRGDLPEPRSRRIVAAIVALGLFAAASGGLWFAFRPTSPGRVAGDTSAVEDVLVVTCAEEGAPQISTPVVGTHPNGIHVLVHGAPNTIALVVRSNSRPGWTWSSGSAGIDDEFVMDATPGLAFARCSSGEPVSTPDPGAPRQPDESTFTILDSAGYWTSTELTCDFDPAPTHYGDDTHIEGEPIEAAVRRMVPGVRSTDIVERAGYPEVSGHRQEIRIVRDGEIVAWASGFGRESWALDVVACAGSGIANS
jgi:hypothetical protein